MNMKNAILALFVVAASVLAYVFRQQPESPQQILSPPEVCSTGVTRMAFDKFNIAQCRVVLAKKMVNIAWSFYPDPPTADGRSTVSEDYNTRYWPTYATTSGLDLYVGGRRFDGETIIERWTFEMPVLASPQTQAVLAVRTKVDVLYTGDQEGRRDVRAMAMMVNRPGELLVQFHDRRELWRFSMARSAWRKLASPNDPSVLLVPELLEEWGSFNAIQHLTEGGFYVFEAPLGKNSTLVLTDPQLVGVLVDSLLLDEDAWHSRGYSDAGNFVPVMPF